jgi:hypothetical protein
MSFDGKARKANLRPNETTIGFAFLRSVEANL